MMSNYKKNILVTTGEPGGIGPEICLSLINHSFDPDYKIILVGDIELLKSRSHTLGLNLTFTETISDSFPKGIVVIGKHLKCPYIDYIGKLEKANAPYVIDMLDYAIDLCKEGFSDIIVTAPVSKEVINDYGINFSGHTEYLAQKFGIKKVVMMLANSKMKVALLTTHIPLAEVPKHVTSDNLNRVISIIINSLNSYGYTTPKIAVCGLNPHAGEGGHLGMEEINIINPIINKWRDKGHLVYGSFPSDTIFNQAHDFDVILAMYHDQGLPVLKYSGFEEGVNITLGLPIIRTSVDHGTALSLAGKNLASNSSLVHAIKMAIELDKCRK